MLNKIKRFLLRQKDVSFMKKSDKSESLYFKIGDHIIRVSDHIATTCCRPEQLHILVTTNFDGFTILVNNRIAVIPNYTKLKEYIKFYILTVGIMGRTVHSVITTTEIVQQVKEVTKETIVPVYKDVEGLSKEEELILSKFRRISPEQRKSYQHQLDTSVASKAAKRYRKASGME